MNKRFSRVVALAIASFAIASPSTSHAGDNPYIGEISWFAGNFAPRGWAFCDGQLLPIAQNSALFSILGTMYGGDGRTTFGLPDMRGRVPLHAGNGAGLTPRTQGEKSGAETVTLTTREIPSHTHSGGSIGVDTEVDYLVESSDTTKLIASPMKDRDLNKGKSGITLQSDSSTANVAVTVQSTGGGESHYNMQPYLGVRCIIALQGTFPSRN